MLQLDQQLHQGDPQAGHDVGWVQDGETADDADGKLADHELLVIHGNEQGTDIFSLREVEVNSREVIETVEHREPNVGVHVGDAGNEQLGQDLVDGGHHRWTFPSCSSL